MRFFKFADALTAMPLLTSQKARGGYFGWTDRYGIRPSYDGREFNAGRPRFDSANT